MSQNTNKKLWPVIVYFDLETTGTDTKTARIVEIACQVEGEFYPPVASKVSEEFSEFVNPGIPIPPEASKHNHITDEMVSSAATTKSVLEVFFAHLSSWHRLYYNADIVLVAHNAFRYDARVLYEECNRYAVKIPSFVYIADTFWSHAAVYPEYKGGNSLATLGRYYRVLKGRQPHRALGDIKLLQAVCLAGILKMNLFLELIETRKHLATGMFEVTRPVIKYND